MIRFLLPLALLLAVPASADELDHEQLAKLASDALARGECAAAEDTARSLQESLPNHPLGWRLGGDAARCTGDLRQAALAYTRAIKLGGGVDQLTPVVETLAASLGALDVVVPVASPLPPILRLVLPDGEVSATVRDGVATFDLLPVAVPLSLSIGGLGYLPQNLPVAALSAGLIDELEIAPSWQGVGSVHLAEQAPAGCTTTVASASGIRAIRAGETHEVTAGSVSVRVACEGEMNPVALEVGPGEIVSFDPRPHRPARLTLVGIPAGSRVRLFVEAPDGSSTEHVFDVAKVGELDPATGVVIAPPQKLGSLPAGVAGLFVMHPTLGTGTATVVLLGGENNASTFAWQSLDGVAGMRDRHETWRHQLALAKASRAGAGSLSAGGAALGGVAVGMFVGAGLAAEQSTRAYQLAADANAPCPNGEGCDDHESRRQTDLGDAATVERDALLAAGVVSAILSGVSISLTIPLHKKAKDRKDVASEWDMAWAP